MAFRAEYAFLVHQDSLDQHTPEAPQRNSLDHHTPAPFASATRPVMGDPFFTPSLLISRYG